MNVSSDPSWLPWAFLRQHLFKFTTKNRSDLIYTNQVKDVVIESYIQGNVVGLVMVLYILILFGMAT